MNPWTSKEPWKLAIPRALERISDHGDIMGTGNTIRTRR